ncbi:YdeI/OmpD-associated family protein [Luedemannella helvata]|uniref:YdeI/OmpD-associated family protein n=1 Tax=Luedemannella helvata TaxID=349315 RepID=UPI0031DF3E0E
MASFEAWMSEWHETADEVWVLFPKKGVDEPSITRSDTLDVALCYGWIDGKAMSGAAPEGWWCQRFTPRRKRSTWSKVNRVRVAKLIEAGRMRPAGLRQVELAKADGRWDAAYDSPSRAEPSPEFAAALNASPAAKAAWDALGSSARYVMIVTLQKLKRPQTRERRIREFITKLAAGS